MNVKKYIKNLEHSGSPLKRRVFFCYYCLMLFRRFFISASYRTSTITRWRYGNAHYQGEVFTQTNRYPLLFSKCAEALAGIESPSILSFGCSTGEEVATIGEYMPQASIMGIDINDWCLRESRKKYAASRFAFYHRFSSTFEDAQSFDVIFCMAVFQHTSNRKSKNNEIARRFTFQQFEQEIVLLDQKLKPGGLFIIDHTDFSFMDTAVATRYQPLDFEMNQMIRQRPLFNKENKKIAETTGLYRIFEKQISW